MNKNIKSFYMKLIDFCENSHDFGWFFVTRADPEGLKQTDPQVFSFQNITYFINMINYEIWLPKNVVHAL